MEQVMRQLALTDSQLAAVRKAAALLQPRVRSQFLQLIALELADVDAIDDDAVRRAIELVLDAASVQMK
jgi:hypothetical protein